MNECVLRNDLRMLATNFYKIIEVNLTEDSYYVVKVEEQEKVQYNGIATWVKEFGKVGVHEDDKDRFYEFFDELSDGVGGKRIVYYRRRIDDSWRWVAMEVLPMDNYEDDDRIVLLLVRDIEDYLKVFNDTITRTFGTYDTWK